MRRTLVATALAATALTGVAGVGSARADTQTYTQSTSISIPDLGYGSPLPSNIPVNQQGIVTKVTMGLRFTSSNPSDVDLLLVSPSGKTVVPISDAGGLTDVAGLQMVFDDAASALPSQPGPLAAGTYQPSDYDPNEPMGMGAPDPPYTTALSTFNGVGASGTWQLYSFADFFNGGGSSSMGPWSLTITTALPDLALSAKKQKLKGKVKVTASSPVGGQLVLSGGVKTKTVQLASGAPTTIKVKVKPKIRRRLAGQIDETGKAKLKLNGSLTDSLGDTDAAKAKLKLK
jgi:hypothetical protein